MAQLENTVVNGQLAVNGDATVSGTLYANVNGNRTDIGGQVGTLVTLYGDKLNKNAFAYDSTTGILTLTIT